MENFNLKTEQLNPIDLYVYSYMYRGLDSFSGIISIHFLEKETELSANTLKDSIKRLENAGYLSLTKSKKGITYNLLKEIFFPPLIFLKAKGLSIRERAYLICISQFMTGPLLMTSADLADKLNITTKTLRTYEKGLIDKGILTIKTVQKDKATLVKCQYRELHT